MVRPERFELPASWFVARRSIQLSYGRKGQIDNNTFQQSIRSKGAIEWPKRLLTARCVPWIPAYGPGLRTRPDRVRGANITTSIADHHSVPEMHIFPVASPSFSLIGRLNKGKLADLSPPILLLTLGKSDRWWQMKAPTT